MKLHVAATVLASFASLISVSADGGQCLSAVTTYAGQQQDVNWTENASYYTINSNANYNNNQENDAEEAEEDAEQAEMGIQYQMQSLAEALGIEFEEDDQDGNYNQYQEMSQMVAYDQDLAEAFGIEDRATFTTFYNILHGLAIAGSCDANNVNQDNAAQYDQYNNQDGYYNQDGNYNQDGDQDAEAEDNEEDNGEDQDAEDEDNEGEQEGQEDGDEGRRLAVLRRRLEDAQDQDAQDQDAQDQDQNAQGQQGYSVANVLRNCGSVFQAYGIDLSNVDMDEDNDELDEALKTLSINIQIEKALESGALDNYNYNFANNDQDGGDGDQGNNGQGYYSVLQILGIDADDLDDDDINEIEAMLAVKSGAFDEYLQNNAAFGQNVEDWEGTLQTFFYSLGMEDVNLEDLSPYVTAEIYNKEYLNEEYGCQVAMIEQFGKSNAVNYGYVDYQDIVDNSDISSNAADYFNAAVSQFTTGQTVGIVVGVLAAVSLLLCAAFVCGKNDGLNSRSSRNEPLWRGTAV